jgi:hypothetical protein
MERLNIELILFFNGTCPKSSAKEWAITQKNQANRNQSLFNNYRQIKASSHDLNLPFVTRTIQFDARNELQTSKITNISNLNLPKFPVFNTLEDHPKEILEFCIQNEIDGLFTMNLELITLFLVKSLDVKYSHLYRKPIFLSRSFLFKTFNGFKAKRINFDKVLSHYNIDQQQFAWLTVLLGTRWYNQEWVNDFCTNLTDCERIEELVIFFSNNINTNLISEIY